MSVGFYSKMSANYDFGRQNKNNESHGSHLSATCERKLSLPVGLIFLM